MVPRREKDILFDMDSSGTGIVNIEIGKGNTGGGKEDYLGRGGRGEYEKSRSKVREVKKRKLLIVVAEATRMKTLCVGMGQRGPRK